MHGLTGCKCAPRLFSCNLVFFARSILFSFCCVAGCLSLMHPLSNHVVILVPPPKSSGCSCHQPYGAIWVANFACLTLSSCTMFAWMTWTDIPSYPTMHRMLPNLNFFTSILKTLQVQSSAAASLCRKRRAAVHPSLQWLAVCKQPRMVETVVPPVDSLEWLCHHSGAHKRARIRVPKNCPNSRADAELSSQLRWQRKLATILIDSWSDSCAPAYPSDWQTGELRALRLAGNTRSSTLRSISRCGTDIASGCMQPTSCSGRPLVTWYLTFLRNLLLSRVAKLFRKHFAPRCNSWKEWLVSPWNFV